MLKKLYTYDIDSQRKMMVPLLLVTIGLGVVIMLLTVVIDLLPDDLVLPYVGLGLLIGACVLGITVIAALMFFLVVIRFYRNLFSDEGYLTFSLPATAKQHVQAKTLSGATWMTLSFFAILLAVVIALSYVLVIAATGASGTPDVTPPTEGIIDEDLLFFGTEKGQGLMLMSILLLGFLNLPASMFSSILSIYLAITLGSLIWTKHKIIGSILFYFVVNMAVSAVSQFVSIGMTFFAAIDIAPAVQFIISLLLSLILQIGVAVASYIITVRMLERRLNLE